MKLKYWTVLAILHITSATEFRIQNNDGGDIWIGIKGNEGKAHMNGGGFILRPSDRVSVHAEDDWSGMIWARTRCNTGNNHCDTGDCGNKIHCSSSGPSHPITKVEFNLNAKGETDYYDISLADGFNIIVSVEPSDENCRKISCTARINNDCPEELRYKINQDTIGCKSACDVFNTDQYCCRNDFDNEEKCKPESWPVNHAQFYKDRCPNAWVYPYDHNDDLFECNAPIYLIVFGG